MLNKIQKKNSFYSIRIISNLSSKNIEVQSKGNREIESVQIKNFLSF